MSFFRLAGECVTVAFWVIVMSSLTIFRIFQTIDESNIKEFYLFITSTGTGSEAVSAPVFDRQTDARSHDSFSFM